MRFRRHGTRRPAVAPRCCPSHWYGQGKPEGAARTDHAVAVDSPTREMTIQYHPTELPQREKVIIAAQGKVIPRQRIIPDPLGTHQFLFDFTAMQLFDLPPSKF